MAPIRPPGRPITSSQLRASRGISISTILAAVKSEPPPSVLPRIGLGQKKAHEHAIYQFDRWISQKKNGKVKVQHQVPSADGKVNIQPTAVASFKEWTEKKLSAPTIGQIQAFLEWHVKGSQGKTDQRLQFRTLRAFLLTFCAAWRRATFKVMPAETRIKALDFCDHLRIVYSLQHTPVRSAKISKRSVDALRRAVWSPELRWSLHERITVLSVMSLAVQTGHRPNPMVGLNGPKEKVDKEKTGALFGEFKLWVKPSGDPTLPNEMYGFFGGRGGKTENSRDKDMPLGPGPHIGATSTLLVLLCLCSQGGLKVDQVRAMFDPAFCNGQPKQVEFAKSWSGRHVFVNSSGDWINGGWMNYRLAQLSILLGFERVVTMYSFRHLVAQSLEAKGVPLRQIADLLGHLRLSSTRIYLGDRPLFDATNVLLDKDPNRHLTDQALRAQTMPNTIVVKKVTDKTILESYPKVMERKRQLAEILEESEDEGECAVDRKKRIRNAQNAVWGALAQAERTELQLQRSGSFAKMRTATPDELAQMRATIAETEDDALSSNSLSLLGDGFELPMDKVCEGLQLLTTIVEKAAIVGVGWSGRTVATKLAVYDDNADQQGETLDDEYLSEVDSDSESEAE